LTITEQTVELARAFAVQAHGDQKYGDEPYVRHLDDVAAIAAPFGQFARVVAYLHDTIEDTDASPDDIINQFGVMALASVEVCTDEPGRNRRERKARTNEKLAASTNVVGLIVKACDRLANVRECVRTGNSRLEMYGFVTDWPAVTK